MKKKFSIVFMGTPDFAVPCLNILAEQTHELPLVITQPDRPRGRGKKTLPPPVKTAAQALGLEVYQPESMKTETVIEKLTSIQPDLFVVVAFGHKLSKDILDIPAIYPINIHASLLPRYRGSSPVQAAILNRDRETGVTAMVMDQGLDTGDILMTTRTPVSPEETAESLHDRLAKMGADLIIKTLDAIADQRITPVPQPHDLASFAPLLKKEDGRIDWTLEPERIDALVRAMNPWPGAFTFLDNKRLKIFSVRKSTKKTDMPPGTVFSCENGQIHVAVKNGAIGISELQGSSGKRLKADQFLRGKKLDPGTRLGQF
ncbi:MAG: methionyl-tRNA formyltransferase [Thermodesulfobacteriota bacterium]|nr:methionyl-tRNA formyltransferase [Thermodesulfobacteriota bacterium]